MKIEELIVAKAVILGFQISNGNVFEQAIRMIDDNLAKVKRIEIKPEVHAFYLMLKSEACRFRLKPDYDASRAEIKDLCELSKLPNLFEIYTDIVQKSTAQYRVQGGGALSSIDARKATLGDDGWYDPDYWFVNTSQHDDANKVLEWMGYWRGSRISDADAKFLFDVNLTDLFKKHFGST